MIEKEHIHSAFDRDLHNLQSSVMRMGGLVEASIINTSRALADNDEELARKIVDDDQLIDGLESEVNLAALELLALRQPIAQDLRFVFAVLKIATNLERIGDYSKNMAKRTTVLLKTPPPNGAVASIRRLSHSVQVLLKDSLDSFAERDAEKAREIIVRDRDIDLMYNSLFREFLTYMMEDPRSITPAMHLHFMAKNLERAGDHITSVSEQVIFQVTGEMPKDDRLVEDTTSYEAVSMGAVN
ncbi:MAG: phosphate signaling complex protein PhoU [Albidovulum sp.]|nr:phosphate signaling complex protein PhoU [Albidovulum sp.]MDE0532326.1 phosphate signaling complex protein PhoU [Albidovulum sp.]